VDSNRCLYHHIFSLIRLTYEREPPTDPEVVDIVGEAGARLATLGAGVVTLLLQVRLAVLNQLADRLTLLPARLTPELPAVMGR